MTDIDLGVVQTQFAEIVWRNEPIRSGDLVKVCALELGWKKPTTYTVLRKLCEKGLFKNEHGIVSSVMSRSDYFALKSEQFIDDTFHGSLPAFLAAFTSRESVSEKEIHDIQQMIDMYKEEHFR